MPITLIVDNSAADDAALEMCHREQESIVPSLNRTFVDGQRMTAQSPQQTCQNFAACARSAENAASAKSSALPSSR